MWYGFHTDHDFAYLLKLVKGTDIPQSGEDDFLQELSLFFPRLLDIKVILEHYNMFATSKNGSKTHLPGSLSKLSSALNVKVSEETEH